MQGFCIFCIIFVNTHLIHSTMKTLHTILYTFIALFLVACNSNEPIDSPEENQEQEVNTPVKEVKQTLCKDKKASRGLPGEDESYLTYKVDGKTLKVEVYNYIVDCATEKVDVESACNEENQITVKLTQVSNFSADCICPMDVSFSLSKLKKGETYECAIQSKSVSGTIYFPLASFSFKMEEGASGKVTF